QLAWRKFDASVIIEPHVGEEIRGKIPCDCFFKRICGLCYHARWGWVPPSRLLALQCPDAPPDLPFSMGRLGFLLPFTGTGSNAGSTWSEARMPLRLTKVDVVHVANEVNLHRGVYPHLIDLKCYVDGRFLTIGIADGLIVADPDGVHRLLLIGR
ncbi:NADH kinase pos5, partial [Massospora cicadina]